jgi:hypothetical protein
VTDEVNLIGFKTPIFANLINQPIGTVAYGCSGFGTALNDFDIEIMLCECLAESLSHALEVVKPSNLRETEESWH